MRSHRHFWLALTWLQLLGAGVEAQSDLNRQVDALWAAPDSSTRSAIAAEMADGRPSFTDVYAALRRGPTYRSDVETGRIERVHQIQGVRHPYFVVVPAGYDPSRQYPIRVFLHGGVRRPSWDSGGQWWREWRRVSGPDFIAVFPAAWTESPWWSSHQIDNVAAILTSLKGSYNVDENRVSLFGVSDGGSGAYLFAFRDAMRWANFLPFIAHPAVLNNPRISLDELFLTNLMGRSFLIINGATDRLYPAASMQQFIAAFRHVGVDLDFRIQPGGHTVSWWPQEAESISRFIEEHPRDPVPDSLSWETERIDRYNRFHWVRIDQVDTTASVLAPRYDPFPHEHAAGRVDIARLGNDVIITTRDVLAFTILLSPEMLNFARPVRIAVNDTVVLDQTFEPSVATLLKWAAVDLDRTMLFGAEIQILLDEGDPRHIVRP